MDHAVPRLSLQLYPQPERRAPDSLTLWPTWPTWPTPVLPSYPGQLIFLFVKSSQVNFCNDLSFTTHLTTLPDRAHQRPSTRLGLNFHAISRRAESRKSKLVYSWAYRRSPRNHFRHPNPVMSVHAHPFTRYFCVRDAADPRVRALYAAYSPATDERHGGELPRER